MVAAAAKRPARRLRGGSARYLGSHRRLLLRVTSHDLRTRYAGSLLGLGWVALAPLLILAVYSVVYLKVYKGRIPGLSGPATITYIFCGLVPYLTIAQGMANGVGSIISNKAVLSNTVFPIDLAPVQSALSAQAVMCVGMPLIVIGAALTGHAHPTLAAFPLIWLLMVIWLVGVNWVISILNTLFRDLQALLTAVLMILLIASPFAYTPSQVPSTLKPLLLLNPFAYFVIAYQQVIMLGELPDAAHVAVLVLMPALTFLFGSWFFAKTKSVAIDYV